MKRPIIAVDCDDVIIETSSVLLERYNKRYGTDVALQDYYVNDLKMWRVPNNDTLTHRLNSYFASEEYLNSPLAQETLAVLRKLKERFDLYIVTGRPDFYEQATVEHLKKHTPDLFADVIFTNFFKLSGGKNPTRTKGDVCIEIGASYLIDDHIHHIESVAAAGITGLLFGDFPWSHGKPLPKGAVRVKDWAAVLEYFDGI